MTRSVLLHRDYAVAVYEALRAAGLRPTDLIARSVDDVDYVGSPLRTVELAWPPVDGAALRLVWSSVPLGWDRFCRDTGARVPVPLDPIASPGAVVAAVAHLLESPVPEDVPSSVGRWHRADALQRALEEYGAGEGW